MADGAYQDIKTTLRSRKLIGGSFVTAGTGARTSPLGDGVSARTGVGTFTVTLPKNYGTCESVVCGISGGAAAGSIDASYSSGVITITTYTNGSAADTTGLSVNWMALVSDRSS